MKLNFKSYHYVFLSILLLSGCASVAERNPNDPYESYNRSMFKFNEKADRYVMRPIAKGYEKITPRPVKIAVHNFFDNFRDAVSMGSNLLRGEVGKAGYDFMRVAVNTTFGLGGLINVADEAGLPSHKTTLGDTFASWGWKKSHYFVYPLTGPSTVCDSIGSTLTSVYPIEKLAIHDKIARYATTGLKAVDTRAQFLPLTDTLEKTDTMDKYAYVRDFYMSKRNHDLGVSQKIEGDADIDELMESDTSNSLDSNIESVNPDPTPKPSATPKMQKKAKSQFTPSNSSARFIDESANDLSVFSRQIWQYEAEN